MQKNDLLSVERYLLLLIWGFYLVGTKKLRRSLTFHTGTGPKSSRNSRARWQEKRHVSKVGMQHLSEYICGCLLMSKYICLCVYLFIFGAASVSTYVYK